MFSYVYPLKSIWPISPMILPSGIPLCGWCPSRSNLKLISPKGFPWGRSSLIWSPEVSTVPLYARFSFAFREIIMSARNFPILLSNSPKVINWVINPDISPWKLTVPKWARIGFTSLRTEDKSLIKDCIPLGDAFNSCISPNMNAFCGDVTPSRLPLLFKWILFSP